MQTSFTSFLIEKGFSTKTSNLSKYVKQMQSDLNIGWEIEVYLDKDKMFDLEKKEEEKGSLVWLSGNDSRLRDLETYVDDQLFFFENLIKLAARTLGRDITVEIFSKALFSTVHEFKKEYGDSVSNTILKSESIPKREEVLSNFHEMLRSTDYTNIAGRITQTYDNIWKAAGIFLTQDEEVYSFFLTELNELYKESLDEQTFRNNYAFLMRGRTGKEVSSVEEILFKVTGYDVVLQVKYTAGGDSGTRPDWERSLKQFEKILEDEGLDGYIGDLTADMSLQTAKPNEFPIEIVSKLSKDFSDGMTALEEMLTFINTKLGARYDKGTGLHVSISFKDRSKEKEIDWLKHAVLSGVDRVIADMGRTDNKYISKFKTDILPRIVADKPHPNNIKNYKRLAKEVFYRLNDKYNYVNLATMSSQNGRIEFRLFGGEPMNNPKEIEKAVYRMIAPLYASMDPEAYHKEYITKLSKILDSHYGVDKVDPTLNLKSITKIINNVRQEIVNLASAAAVSTRKFIEAGPRKSVRDKWEFLLADSGAELRKVAKLRGQSTHVLYAIKGLPDSFYESLVFLMRHDRVLIDNFEFSRREYNPLFSRFDRGVSSELHRRWMEKEPHQWTPKEKKEIQQINKFMFDKLVAKGLLDA